MIDSLAKALIENGLEPALFAPAADETILRGQVPAGRVMQTWLNLAKAANETKYWPIIRGDFDDIHEQPDRDPAAILAAAPPGNITEILQPRFEGRRNFLCQMVPKAVEANDMYELAAMADTAPIYTFGGRPEAPELWPDEPAHQGPVTLYTLKQRKRRPSSLVLLRMEHSYDAPAYLGYGGENCPEPELQVAVLREWKAEYGARPACITGDVLECVVTRRPQTEAAATKLAAEQWIFCEDIVGQGTQSVRKLAMEIWQAPTWFFWWD